MRRAGLFILIFVLTVPAAFVGAQDSAIKERKEISPGVEVVRIGSANIIVPKGATVTEKDGTVTIEDIGQYTGRRFEAVEEHLSQLDKKSEDLQKETEQLKAERLLQLETEQEMLRGEIDRLEKERLFLLETQQQSLQDEMQKLKEERFSQIEARQEDLRKEIEQLKTEQLLQINAEQENLGKEIKQLREELRKELKKLRRTKRNP